MKNYLILFFLLTSLFTSFSQTTSENKLGAWYMYNGSHKISNKFDIITGTQLRSFEVLDNINLLFLYTGFNYNLNKNTKLTFGYCYLDIDRSFSIAGESHLYENRPYEQISYNHHLSKVPIYHRLRLEHRLLNFKHTHQTINRFRYRLGTKITLNKDFFFNISDEVFANLKGDVFTENRFYAAIGISISKSNNIQVGYLNHEINHLNLNRLQVSLNIKTDWTKKKI